MLPISWELALPVRHEVLWPDKDVNFCLVDGDEEAMHFGAYLEGKIICVASIYLDGTHARLRKFATLPDYQNKGVGSAVLTSVLEAIEESGITFFWCDARKSAMGFYDKFGLKPQGAEFYKSGVPYYKMSKIL